MIQGVDSNEVARVMHRSGGRVMHPRVTQKAHISTSYISSHSSPSPLIRRYHCPTLITKAVKARAQ
ncbi:hypothetical protein HO173_012812 [Letharia columbiana]|uniref:Uncharacterized protein n=1 Tax=Letharia columbiana TaxID=112416 RepID=A0A8H6CL11_9LECA|nr:uncharacterized protein HO173_012812 [Letharia columbiana]KAF6225327.1 hypothetical protein HO173_012812 [Letharia columbiana]